MVENEERKTVVFITDQCESLLPGLVAKAITRYKCELFVPTPSGHFDEQCKNWGLGSSIIKHIDLPGRSLPGTTVRHIVMMLGFYAKVLLSIAKRRRQFKGALFYAIDLPSSPIAFVAAKLTSGSFIVDYRELFCERTHVEARWLWRLAEKAIIPTADRVITRSPGRADYLKAKLGLRCRPTVILNAKRQVDLSEGSECALLDELDTLPPSCRIVLYQGTLSFTRGLDKLAASLEFLPDNYTLVMVGPTQSGLRELILDITGSLGVSRRIILYEDIPQGLLPAVMERCHVGVLMYRNVSLNDYLCAPTKLYDYLSSGLPVVGPSFPDIVSILGQHDIGGTFDPENPQSIAGAIRLVCDNEANYEKLRRNVKRASPLYNYETESSKLLEAIARTLSSPHQDAV